MKKKIGRKNNLKKRIIYSVVCFTLFLQQMGFTQVVGELNISGYLAGMHSSISIDKFRPLHLRYFSYELNSDNFKFLFDKGDLKQLEDAKFKELSAEPLKYFLIGITLPDSKFWVNLRPDSEGQIIEPELEQTDMGKVFLEADLQLKKDTAKYTSPETPEGREYWNKFYKKAEELFGYEAIAIPTFTRPWIVPGEIIVRETQESAFIYKSTLKVCLEHDYLKDSATYSFKDARMKALNEYSSQLIRELIIPKLTKEVNISKKYAALRQVFYSLILSRWFKTRFKGQSSFYASLIDSKNLNGLTSKESWSKTNYFKEYQKSFNNGEHNIKESVYTPRGQVIRSYFSGGILAMPTNEQLTGMVGKEIYYTANPHLILAVSDKSITPSQDKISLPLIKLQGYIGKDTKQVADSPVQTTLETSSPINTGGIDFRVMNIVTQPLVSSPSVNLKLLPLANLAKINLDEELQQLQNMFAAGIVPSGERIKEYLAVCQLKGEWNIRIVYIISCLVEICRLEEDNVNETPLEIKEALIIADSGNLGS